MTEAFRIAVVGCGGIASYAAVVSKTIPNFKISACVSKLPEEAQAFAKKHHVPIIFEEFDDLLKPSNKFDALYLSTPHFLHAPMIREAVNAGIPVLCEKPITESLATAKEIVEFVGQHDTKVGINYQYRYNAACQRLIHYTRNDIGQLYYIRINIPWHREKNYFNHSTWHKKLSAAGGGTLLTQGSHFLDIALQAANQTALSAIGVTDQKVFSSPDIEIEDFAQAIITLEDRSHIEITSSMVATPQQSATIEVYGDKGYARYAAKERPHFLTKGVKPSSFKSPGPPRIHYLASSLEGFKNWIMKDKPYRTPIHSALPVMAAIDAVYRSAQSGKSERIEQSE